MKGLKEESRGLSKKIEQAALRADRAGEYHLLIGLARIVLALRGACRSIREVRVEFYASTRSDRLGGGCVISLE